MTTALQVALSREKDLSWLESAIEEAMGLLGAVIAHIDLHPRYFENPSGRAVCEKRDRAAAAFLRPRRRHGSLTSRPPPED